jgi:uncharacterized protein YbjT (DUF2867 family)
MNVLVVGDEASLASTIAAGLRARGHDAVVAPHIASPASLETAELAEVLAGAATVIDVAGPPSYDGTDAWTCFTAAAGNLLSAARLAGVGHVVALSVVGTGRLLSSGYFRAKALQEQLIRESRLPFSIVRATQSYDALGRIADSATDGDTVRIPPALVQPIAPEDLGSALAAAAVAVPVDGIHEVAGPHQYRLDDLVRAHLRAYNDDRRVLADPHARFLGARVDDHLLLPSSGAALYLTDYSDWLTLNTFAAVY